MLYRDTNSSITWRQDEFGLQSTIKYLLWRQSTDNHETVYQIESFERNFVYIWNIDSVNSQKRCSINANEEPIPCKQCIKLNTLRIYIQPHSVELEVVCNLHGECIQITHFKRYKTKCHAVNDSHSGFEVDLMVSLCIYFSADDATDNAVQLSESNRTEI